MRFVGFIGPSYKLQSVNVDAQRCLNLYPELDELGTGKEREVASLVGTPGLLLLVDLANGVTRGVFTASNGQLFAVNGNGLFRIDSSWSKTLIGSLNSSTGLVSMADNGTSLFVVDGPNGYTHTLGSSSLSDVTDPNWMGATKVTYQDGYFIFLQPSSAVFYTSNLNDISINASDATSAEAQPDLLVSILSDQRNLWLFGTNTTEIFYDAGDANNPFQRIDGAFIEYGCVSPFCVSAINNTVFWVGQDLNGAGVVYMANGYQAQRISTHAVEYAIQSYGDLSQTVGYTYQQNGHFFYALNFTSADTTWVFDVSTSLWHERAYNNNGVLERHRANFHAFAYSTHVVGDYENGLLYSLSPQVFTDNGEEITRMRASPHMTSELKRIFYSSFQLDVESGVGLDGVQQGDDPQAMLQWSDDGGHSWSNEKWASLGKIGQTKMRALWRRLGASKDRIFKVTITDPVKVTLIGAELQVEKGAS